jgi:hypothetical protein
MPKRTRTASTASSDGGDPSELYSALLAQLQSSSPQDIAQGEALAGALGFTLRLSTEAMVGAPAAAAATPNNLLHVYDQVVPPRVLELLCSAFQPSSPFFALHDYHDNPRFFSYVYEVRTQPPANLVEQVIQTYLWPIMQAATTRTKPGCEIACCEWWVHARDARSGHQLHFDSNETHLMLRGEVLHPVYSTVLVLSPGSASQPLLVIDQRLHEDASEQVVGWRVEPDSPGRLVAFDGSLLHGVIPQLGKDVKGGHSARITLMTGWWASSTAEPTPLHRAPGPNRVATETDVANWGLACVDAERLPAPPPTAATAKPLPSVRVWQSVPPSKSKHPLREFAFVGFYLLKRPGQVREQALLSASKGVAGQTLQAMGALSKLHARSKRFVQAVEEFARVAVEHPDQVGLALASRPAFASFWLRLLRARPDVKLAALDALWSLARHQRVADVVDALLRDDAGAAMDREEILGRAACLCWSFGAGDGAAEQAAAIAAWLTNAKAVELLALVAQREDAQGRRAMDALTEAATRGPEPLQQHILALFAHQDGD